jgi:glycine/D-amino acid oxidase-like deaminating enzyme
MVSKTIVPSGTVGSNPTPSATSSAVWRYTAEPGVLAVLDPGVPTDLDRRPDVLVVGGGVMGLATAACCVRAGLGRVTLIERETLASGPSGRAGAVLVPEFHRFTDPAPFVALGRSSLALYRRLDEEWDGALGLEALDCLLVLPDGVDQVAPSAELEVLDTAGLRALVPELAPAPGGLLLRDQARVHPLRLAAALAARAGTVLTGIEMVDLDTSDGRIDRVQTSHGEFQPGHVVLATGNSSVLDTTGVESRLVKGHLLATDPVAFRLEVMLATVDGLIGQLPDGRLLAGGTLDEGDDSPEVRADVVAAIHGALTRQLPAARGAGVSHAWCCFRPAVGDRQPVVDRLPAIRNAWVTAGHYRTGILMAAAVGDGIAEWIGGGVRPEPLEPFGLARFVAGQ